MRVGLKLTLIILSMLVVVLSVEGWLRLQHEREVFESDVEHEQRVLGRALRPSIELAWRTQGAKAARTILSQAQRGEAEVRIRLVALSPEAIGASPSMPLSIAQSAAANNDAAVIDRTPQPGVVYTYVPVTGPEGAGTAIELSESLGQAEARLSRSGVRVAWTALVIALGAGLLAVGFGERIVGRPVRDLAAQAKRIARGDLTPPGPSSRHDEIGQLKTAIADMVHGLAEARDRVAQETEARLEAERRLRHGERLVAVGTLAAGVAHELGTPLQIVSGRARMIERAPHDHDAAGRNASIVREQAQRMERIVRQLLHLAQPAHLMRTPVSMGAVVEETVELLAPNAERREVSLTADTEDPGRVSGDPHLLGQVIANLVQNAIQASSAGHSVQIRVGRTAEVAPPLADLKVAPLYVTVEVQDTGAGIGPDILPQLFDPFFTTKEVGQGTGLGLSVAYGIAQEHDGWIEVESEVGVGTLFRVLLPAEETDA